MLEPRASKLRLSVIIPAYNAGDYIRKCLASIARQSIKPFEVIVVDGLSKDDTVAAANSFANILPLRVFSEKDEGQPDAVTKGLRIATGDIAHWHAADDLVMPGAFEAVIDAFEDPDIDLVYSDGWAFDDHQLVRSSSCRWTCFDTAYLFFGRFQSDCAYWRHSLTAQCLPLDNNMQANCDEDWFLRIWASSRKSRWLPLRLGAFRMRPTQLSQTLSRANLDKDRARSRDRAREIRGISRSGYNLRRALWAPRYYLVDDFIGAIDRLWSRFYKRGSELKERESLLRFLLDEWIVPPL